MRVSSELRARARRPGPFRASATALVAAGASCKLCAFAWYVYVWPAKATDVRQEEADGGTTEEGYLRDLAADRARGGHMHCMRGAQSVE